MKKIDVFSISRNGDGATLQIEINADKPDDAFESVSIDVNEEGLYIGHSDEHDYELGYKWDHLVEMIKSLRLRDKDMDELMLEDLEKQTH